MTTNEKFYLTVGSRILLGLSAILWFLNFIFLDGDFELTVVGLLFIITVCVLVMWRNND
jgi:hypothetical protein